MKNNVLGKGGTSIFFFLLLMCCFPLNATARKGHFTAAFQQQTITGSVSDATGPLPGVTIHIKGTRTFAVTDAKGGFAIVAALGDTLTLELMGYQTREIMVTTANLGVIILAESAKDLEEVTINAGYYSVRQKEATGNISRITAEDIENQPVTNVLATVQGRMPGVNIVQNTGVPGGGFDVQIRGQNSLRSDGNSPLYIVDGIPYASQNMGSGLTGMVMAGQVSPLNNINPADISSIEVLKDADATAIYGSRGANGVVLITTKKGSEGKAQFSVRAATGVAKATRFMDLMDTSQYLEMRRQAFANDAIAYGPSDYDVNGAWDASRYTNWQKVLLGGSSAYRDLGISLSGGSQQTQFLISGNLHDESTVFPGDFGYNKASLLASFSHRSADSRLSINFSSTYTTQRNRQPGTDLTQAAAQLAPNAPALYSPDGSLNWENSTWTNPLSTLESHYRSTTFDLATNGVLSYEVFPGLVAKSGLGFTQTDFEDSRTAPSTMYDPAWEAGSEFSSIYTNTVARRSWVAEPQLSYSRAFDRFRGEALIGGTFQEQRASQLVQNGEGFVNNSMIYNLAAADFHTLLSDMESTYRYQAVLGRLNLSWDQRYILNLTGKRDGSSRFGPGRQFANFGAVGFAWLFSREKFMERATFLSFGKLRVSYGTSGNDQIGDYQFLDTYSSSGNSYGVPGLQPSRLYNPDFGWETNEKFEIGLEASFLNERIALTAAYFSNRSSSQLVGIPLPATTGFTTLQANLGATVQNSGMELSLSTKNILKKDFSWSTGFNITMPRNKLLSFPGLESSTYQNMYLLGQPISITRLYHLTGIDPLTRTYQFQDYNGDGQVTAEQDRMAYANLGPTWYGGLSNSIHVGSWQLNFLFQFVKQRGFNGAFSNGLPGTMVNQSAQLLSEGYAQPYTTGADPLLQEAFYRYAASDAAITDTSFIRLKNASLSYSVPKGWIKGVNCRLNLEGQNLFVITPYRGADPETRTLTTLPPMRVLTAGIQLNF